MILFDATHTSHTRAHTGIQRVCRALARELAAVAPLEPLCFDPYLKAWRRLDRQERATLDGGGTASKSRGAKWSLRHRVAGHVGRLVRTHPPVPQGRVLICPELFSAQVGAHLPEIMASTHGAAVAVFHDAIGLRFPDLTPRSTVARLPAYLRELLVFDGIAAVSEDSAASLRDYWEWLGVTSSPPVIALPLGVEPRLPPWEVEAETAAEVPSVLCVSTIEGRKNHLALLDACETLWSRGRKFELRLVGMARPETGSAALAQVRRLQAAGRNLHYSGAVPDATLDAAYRRCAFTVYPSPVEGFGLPILESIRHGRPCICSGTGALGESARGGGCLVLESVDAASLEAAIQGLLDDPAQVRELESAARRRTLRPWLTYATELLDWASGLRKRSGQGSP